jgi:hypothetical protein
VKIADDDAANLLDGRLLDDHNEIVRAHHEVRRDDAIGLQQVIAHLLPFANFRIDEHVAPRHRLPPQYACAIADIVAHPESG